MILVLTTETGPMEQVHYYYSCHATWGHTENETEMESLDDDETLFLFFIEGVGNDPREDRYFSIPKQVSNFFTSGN